MGGRRRALHSTDGEGQDQPAELLRWIRPSPRHKEQHSPQAAFCQQPLSTEPAPCSLLPRATLAPVHYDAHFQGRKQALGDTHPSRVSETPTHPPTVKTKLCLVTG